jgi:hypothetical protein
MTHYEDGYFTGQYRREHDDFDPRFTFADVAREGKEAFAEFKRGFEDGFDGKDRDYSN